MTNGTPTRTGNGTEKLLNNEPVTAKSMRQSIKTEDCFLSFSTMPLSGVFDRLNK